MGADAPAAFVVWDVTGRIEAGAEGQGAAAAVDGVAADEPRAAPKPARRNRGAARRGTVAESAP